VFHVVTTDLFPLRDRELRDRKIELAVMPVEGLLQQNMNAEILFDDRHVVLAAAKSKWSRRRNLALADLIDEPWVLPPPDSPVGSYIAGAFRAAGLPPPRARVPTFSIPLHQSLLATGHFLTALPLSMLHHHEHLPLKMLSVNFPAPPRPVGMVTLRNRMLSPLAQLFIDCARKVAEPLAKAR
jgi:DNA-binding transcriptional LysR family regulator